jgi:hypothetical protein
MSRAIGTAHSSAESGHDDGGIAQTGGLAVICENENRGYRRLSGVNRLAEGKPPGNSGSDGWNRTRLPRPARKRVEGQSHC